MLSMSLNSVEKLMMYFPTEPKRLFAVPGYGWASTISDGPKIADAFKMVKEKFNIEFLGKEEFLKEYKLLVNFINRTEYVYEEKISSLADEFSKGLYNYTPGFNINSKMILLYLEKAKIIKMYNNGCYEITPKGLSAGFIVENKKHVDGSFYSILTYNKKGFEFIKKSLPPIIQNYYGKNPLNIYHNQPEREFIFDLYAFDSFNSKLKIDRILNYHPEVDKYTSRLSKEELSLALNALNFVASIIDPESKIKEFANYIGLKTKSSSNFYCIIYKDLTLKFDDGRLIQLKNINNRKILEFVNGYKKISSRESRIQKGLIFDLDGTVFDTNCIREERRKNGANYISKHILDRIKLVKGFESLFLKPDSDLYLNNNKVLFITSSPEAYAKYLLKLHGFNGIEAHFACNTTKSKIIAKFIERSGLQHFIAFGDEEKDAQLYSQCGVPFYIVNKYYGYDTLQDLRSNIIVPNKKDFRHEFMYDILKKKYDLDSEYFDDFVVYYCRYYDKTDYYGNCPVMPGRKIFEKIKYSEFKDKKGEYVRNHIKDLMQEDYNNLGVSLPKNVVFARVPGHDEISYKPNSPCSILIKELCKVHGYERDYSDFLRRNSVVMNHDAGRNIEDHVRTIVSITSKNIKGKTVYLFDDVGTTGTQMSVCIDKLYKAGAGHVVCFCIGRTCPGDGYTLNEIEGGYR